MRAWTARAGLATSLQLRASAAGFLINLAGGLSLAVYMLVVYPVGGQDSLLLEQGVGLGAVALFNVGAGLSAYRTASPWWASMRDWLAAGGAPSGEQCRAVLALPMRYARMTAVRWLLGIAAVRGRRAVRSRAFAIEVAVATALAGLTATAAVYLAIEWRRGPPSRSRSTAGRRPTARSLGIAPRLLLTWVLCSGRADPDGRAGAVGRDVQDPKALIAPICSPPGMAMGAASSPPSSRPRRSRARSGSCAARSTPSPTGDLDVAVPVDDGSEVGLLQAGFNRMVDGLREREQLRDLFGRQVGDDVAREALERGIELGGEEREVAALFVDVVGSTELAARERAGAGRGAAQRRSSPWSSTSSRPTSAAAWSTSSRATRRCACSARPCRSDDPAGARARRRARAARAASTALDGGLDAGIGVAGRHRRGRQHRRRAALRVHGRSATRSTRRRA